MKKLFCLIILCGALSLHGQEINNAGHFIRESAALPAKQTSEPGLMEYGDKQFKGNTLFKSSTSYVSLDGNYENAPAAIFVYNESGELRFENSYSATINFVLSANKRFCAFYDKERVHALDLETNKETTRKGSYVFAVDDEGKVAVFDEETSTIGYGGLIVKTEGKVSQILANSSGLYFSTEHSVYRIDYTTAKKIFDLPGERIFEMYAHQNNLYISARAREEKGFRFTAYKGINSQHFQPYQSTFYELKTSGMRAVNKSGGVGEQTANPLDYYTQNPFHPIGNSYGEIQEYGGLPYPHPGVDLFGNYHDSVYAVRQGFIKAIITTAGFAHWRVAISNSAGSGSSIGYLYAHLDQNTIPFLVGDPVNSGDVIGLLVNFPVVGFIHCHFARIMGQGSTWNGSWWTLDDPLTFIAGFADSTAPVFQKTINNDVFAFRTPQGSYISKDSLFGQVDVLSKVYDLANSSWALDVHRLRYSVSPLALPLVRLIDTLAFEYNFFIDTYFSTNYSSQLIRTIYSRDNTCFSTGHYNARDFYHIVSHTNGNDTIEPIDSLLYFSTTSLQDGSYIFRVEAWDAVNNYAKDSIIFKVRNLTTGISGNIASPIRIFPNPSSTGKYNLRGDALIGRSYMITDATGRQLVTGMVTEQMEVDISRYGEGIYFIEFSGSKNTKPFKLVRQ